jgi:hypothetical protein
MYISLRERGAGFTVISTSRPRALSQWLGGRWSRFPCSHAIPWRLGSGADPIASTPRRGALVRSIPDAASRQRRVDIDLHMCGADAARSDGRCSGRRSP